MEFGALAGRDAQDIFGAVERRAQDADLGGFGAELVGGARAGFQGAGEPLAGFGEGALAFAGEIEEVGWEIRGGVVVPGDVWGAREAGFAGQGVELHFLFVRQPCVGLGASLGRRRLGLGIDDVE